MDDKSALFIRGVLFGIDVNAFREAQRIVVFNLDSVRLGAQCGADESELLVDSTITVQVFRAARLK